MPEERTGDGGRETGGTERSEPGESRESSPELTPPPREPQSGEHSRLPSPVSRPSDHSRLPSPVSRPSDHSRLPSPVSRLLVSSLGTLPYSDALLLQRAVARARIAGSIADDVLLLVEHPPVITMGRSSKSGHLVASPALLAARGVEHLEVDRGGDVTFHGPGQLVGYPIFDLKRHKQDLHWYLRQVEEALIRAIAPFGIVGERNAGYTGVWVNDRKLASIGVHARDWVTWHGFALNVRTDLSWFDLIVPCGISGVTMTSLERELGERGERPASDDEVEAAVIRGFESTFSLVAEPLAAGTLGALLESLGTEAAAT